MHGPMYIKFSVWDYIGICMEGMWKAENSNHETTTEKCLYHNIRLEF